MGTEGSTPGGGCLCPGQGWEGFTEEVSAGLGREAVQKLAWGTRAEGKTACQVKVGQREPAVLGSEHSVP